MVRHALEDNGHAVDEAENGKVGVRRCREGRHDLVLCDIVMPDQEGLETIRELVVEFPRVQIVAMSGSQTPGPMDVLMTAAMFGARATLNKPFSLDELRLVVFTVLNDSMRTAGSGALL